MPHCWDHNYAQALIHARVGYALLYGLVYKGIPLVAATAGEQGRDVPA